MFLESGFKVLDTQFPQREEVDAIIKQYTNKVLEINYSLRKDIKIELVNIEYMEPLSETPLSDPLPRSWPRSTDCRASFGQLVSPTLKEALESVSRLHLSESAGELYRRYYKPV